MFERIKNMFRIGGAKLGMVQQLEKIIDHPKISMDQEEYDRIRDNKQIYKSVFPDVSYLSSDNVIQEREFHSLNVSKVLSRKLSKLVFNDGCSLSVDDKKADEFLQTTFNTNKFRKNFGEELEAGYAIGGLVLRPYVDGASKEIKIAVLI